MHGFTQPISEYIWDIKYRYRANDTVIDKTLVDTWQRIAKTAAQPESMKERQHWQQEFYAILEDFAFLPGGRILAGAGIDQDVTLFNCFVMQIKKDSLSGIFNALKEGAITLQKGGGIGYDFSILRPSGSSCLTTQAVASGPVSFMRVWDAMSSTMLSSAARRGAMMANLRCDHPDIEQFIHAKADKRELRQFNLSVIVTSEFMRAVEQDADWPLVFPANPSSDQARIILRRWSSSAKPIPCEIYKTISARRLWDDIIKAAYSYAEPGVIFEDTINDFNPLYYHEWLNATNPCGEIPLPPFGACNLGSLNLTKFVRAPFSKNASFNWHALEKTTEIATRFLDNIIDVSQYPLKLQHKQSLNTRRIGLGFTGLADVFIMLGIHYGSKQSLEFTAEVTKKLAYTTWNASIQLAQEKGSFPFYNKKYQQGKFVLSLPEEIQRNLKKSGIRNSHHNAIAPTGSISLLANNVSGGLEPVFGTSYQRKVRTKNGEMKTFHVEDYAYHLWKTTKKEQLPATFIDVNQLTPDDHLNIQGVVQPYIDNAISKTINLPENFPLSQLTEVYTKAYELKLKGCTIFRPNPITGSILSKGPEPDCDRCFE